MLREQQFDAGAVTLNFAEGPENGEPLVLLHGIAGFWRNFWTVLPQLAFNNHVYALDFRGHGGSSHVANGYTFEAYAQDVIAFLQGLQRPATLLGHSLGGLIAISVAAQAPANVRAVILEDPPLWGHKGERLRVRPNFPFFLGWRDIAASGMSGEAVRNALIDLHPNLYDAAELRLQTRAVESVDPDVLTMYVEGSATTDFDMDALLPRLACPTLLLRGDPRLGGAIEDDDEQRARALVKDLAVVRVANAGHWIRALQPAAFLNAALSFLGALS